MKKDTVQKFLKLPRIISFEGIDFAPSIFINGSNDVRLVYNVVSVSDTSIHKKMWDEYGCWPCPFGYDIPANQGFLFLRENIETETELFNAIESCIVFLLNHKLLS